MRIRIYARSLFDRKARGMTFIIAEISNHHLGSVEKAKELIRVAKESGADAVKGQAFEAEDMLKWGTMPFTFYEKCALKYQEYKELILYGKEIGVPVFFTILSSKLTGLGAFQDYTKLHAGYVKSCRKQNFWYHDKKNTIISMNEPRLDVKKIKTASILYATAYLKDVDYHGYETLQKFYERDIGVSHHGISSENLINLSKSYKIPVVEKHFYLGDEIKFIDHLYRDCVHSYTPSAFSSLVRALK